MFARLTRIPLRRSIHTQAARPHSFRYARAALGTSAVTVAYLAWRSLSDPIALDSATPTQSIQKPTVASKPPSKAPVTSPASNTSIPEPTPTPNSEPSTEHLPPQDTDSDTTSPKPEGEGEGEREGKEGEGEEGEGSSDGAASGGAFNPETGEINWDCPCLGGMAHGPCGPEFREAFSCFVFSEQEPKGIDCVEKFKGMQDCFRRHPDVYGDELMDDDEEEEAAAAAASTDAPEHAHATHENQENASTDTEASISKPQTPPTPP